MSLLARLTVAPRFISARLSARAYICADLLHELAQRARAAAESQLNAAGALLVRQDGIPSLPQVRQRESEERSCHVVGNSMSRGSNAGYSKYHVEEVF
eukprot:6198983-Pleurochrysis_carterae.AAC.10